LDNYYVYAHVNATTGVIFYIGKGKTYRAKSLHRRSERWHNYVKKYGYTIMYIEEHLTQEQSFLAEIHYIKAFGRKDLGVGELINMSDGGVGGNNNKGRKLSKEWREKIAQSGRGRVGPMRGKAMSDERKEKISNSMKGRSNFWLKGKEPSELQMKYRLDKTHVCEYCGAANNIGNHVKYHRDKCKHKNGRILKTPKVHPDTKLSLDIANAIREEYRLGGTSHMKLSLKYGVSTPVISQIIHNKAWKIAV